MSQILLSFSLALFIFGQNLGFTMERVFLKELLAATGGRAIGSFHGNSQFTGVGIDSRTICANEVFWAVQGERHDGHDFVADAYAGGAAASVVQANVVQANKVPTVAGPMVIVPDTLEALWAFARWYRERQEALVIGVTGSVGKTTTREMIHTTLGTHFAGTQSPRNFNNQFGVPLSILEIDKKHEFAVLELAASKVGEIRELAGIASPEIGVVTAIGLAHLEGFGSEENIINAKGELVEALPPSGFAVLCGDDPRVRRLADRAACPVILVGEAAGQDVRATHVELGRNRIDFRVDGTRYELRVTGRHHLTAALSAIAIAREIGIPACEIREGLKSFVAVAGRCQFEEIGPWTVIDDTYNANPSSMQAACAVLRDWRGQGKKMLIAGDMLELGDRTAICHRELGQSAAIAGINHLMGYGQQAGHVVHGALDAGMPAHGLAECESFDAMLAVLDCWLEPGDVVLVKGSRAMRMERVIEWLRARAETGLENTRSRVLTRACA